LLHHFLGICLREGGRARPVNEVLAEFREYREEIEKLREEIRPSLERSLRGECKPIDWDEFYRRGRERLAARGITD
jgi:hypothetical protein